MKIYLKENVLDAATKRIEWLFDEFPNVVIGCSGGKDSTVVLNLALSVAARKNRLPLTVMFLDQEAEWQSTRDYVRRVMDRPDVKGMWFQMPMRLFNATSTTKEWLNCWEEGKQSEWVRPKEPDAITVNRYGTDRFVQLFTNILQVEFPDTPTCYLAGIRCQESATRLWGITSHATYKHVTYGKCLNRKRKHYTFYPIYDWTYTDVWKYIHSNGFDYNTHYDKLFQYGVPIREMRVSNLNHETAVRSLYFLQEVEPQTWNRVANRLAGVKMTGQLKGSAFEVPKELPYMFADWREYRDYLLRHLSQSDKVRKAFMRKFASMDKMYDTYPDQIDMIKTQITAILLNDYHSTKIHNWETSPVRHLYRRMKADPNAKVYVGKYLEGLQK